VLKRKIISMVLCISLMITSLCGSLFISTKGLVTDDDENKTTAVIKNGSFEEGKTHWEHNVPAGNNYHKVVTTKASDGEKSVQLYLYNKLYQLVEVEPNTDYTLYFDCYGPTDGNSSYSMVSVNAVNSDDTLGSEIKKLNNVCKTKDRWLTREISFNSGSNSKIIIGITEGGSTNNTFVDNFVLKESPLVKNGSFEEGKTHWEHNVPAGNNYHNIVTTKASDGEKSVQLYLYNKLYQLVEVEPNTNYTLYFDCYGPTDGNSSYSIVSVHNVNSDDTLGSEIKRLNNVCKTKDKWLTREITFNSGSNTKIIIGITEGGETNNTFVDNFVLNESPLVKNGSFEEGKAYWEYNGADTSGITANQEIVSDGEKSMKLKMYYWLYQLVEIEANTNYTLYFDAYGPSGNTSWTNVFIYNVKEDGTKGDEITRISNVCKTNGEWLEREVSFNSGSNTKIIIGITDGTDYNNTYVDNFVLVKDKLIKNGSFEDGETSWDLGGGNEIDTTIASDGEKSVSLKTYYHLSQTVTVEKNSTYKLSFDVKNPSNLYGQANIYAADSSKLKEYQIHNHGTSGWETISYTFETGENTSVKIDIVTDNEGMNVDNFVLEKVLVTDDAIVKNGSFEDGETSWDLGGGNEIDTTIASDGEKSVSLKTYYHLSQTVTVEKNSTYKLSFDVKNPSNLYGQANIYAADSSKLKEYQIHNHGTSGWETISYTFETGENTSVKIDIVTDNEGMNVDNFVLEKVLVTDDAIVKNGSFEDGETSWDLSGGNKIVTTTASDGEKSLFLKKWYHLKQEIKIEKNKSYRLCFDIYNPSRAYGQANIYALDNSKIQEFQMHPYGNNGWESVGYVFKSGENTTVRLDFVGDGEDGENIIIDNVIVIETDSNNLVVNGDFELNKLGWKFDENYFDISEIGKSGKGITVKSGYHKILSQNINLEKETNYKLSFDYKGETSKEIASFAISKDDTFNSYSVITKGKLTSSNVWEKVEIIFSSGVNTTCKLLFQTSDETNYLIDNIRIEKTSETAEKNDNSRAVFVGSISESYWSHDVVVPQKGANLIKNEDFNSTSTHKVNNATYFKGNAGSIVEGKEASYFGDKALMIEVTENKEVVSIPLKLEKNKTYYIGLYSKVSKFEAEKGTFFSYGISDPDSGNFIRPEDINSDEAKVYTDSIQLMAQYDNSWHYNLFEIRTNGQERLDFTIIGKQVTAYIDKLYVFDPEKSEEFLGTLEKLSNVTITAEKANKLGIKNSGINLFENFDLSEKDTYWSDKKILNNWVFGDTLNIKDSMHSVQKNTLLYDNYRKYPRNIYYIKWVDVKPDTEYTFSAKYTITKTGGGYFGIVSGYNSGDSISSVSENVIHPTLVKKYNFSEDSYDVDQNWQNVGFSFNTGDRNRVGFFVQDGGGTAYIDDLRLFETKNGEILKDQSDNFPNQLESKDSKIKVDGNRIYGIEPATKLSSILVEFKNTKYIRVFDALGEEVTDYSTFAATGMEIRLMNGPVIKARATIVIAGDVTGDGILNKDDSEAIIKSLSNEKPLESVYLEAADYDGDGKVTVFDSLLGKKSAQKGNGNFILEGPKKFAVGDEIEISLVAQVDNVLALSGKLNFEKGVLDFVSAKTIMNGDWILSYSKSSTEVIFAATDLAKSKGTVNGKAVITFTFVVGDVQNYSDIELKLLEMFSATEMILYSSNEYIWPNSQKTDNNDENSDVVENATEFETEVLATGNRLSLLKIDEAEITPEFDPEIKQYTATVPYEIEKVTVTAIAADENATVNIGDTNLEFIGKNAVDVEVFSVEGYKRTYRIIVTREAPDMAVNNDGGLSVWVIVAIIAGGVLIVAAGSFVAIILVKKKRKKTS